MPCTMRASFLAIICPISIARLEQLGRRDDLVEKADALGLLGGDDPAGVEQFLGLRQADQQPATTRSN